MGDISTEPSMEDILSSIKRIIAEEGDGASASRARRTRTPAPTPAPQMLDDDDRDEILELNVDDAVEPPTPPRRVVAPEPVAARPAPAQPAPAPAAAPIVSAEAAQATRGPLEALSRLIVKPETTGSDTLEGLVREMLRPMLREWLDANLPGMVEAMVAREIARITGQGD